MPTRYTKPTISGYNTNPPSDDGQQVPSNEITWAKHKAKLADPIKTLVDAINTETESVFNEHAKVYNTEFLQTISDIQNGLPISLFRFVDRSKHSALRAGTNTDDMSTDLQEAVDTGASIIVPEGKFHFESTVQKDTSGEGIVPGLVLVGSGWNTEFVNAINNAGAGAEVLDLTSGTSASDFMYGGIISGIKFTESSSGTDGHAIQYQGCWHQRFENLWMQELTGAALRAVNTSSDADSSAHVAIKMIRAISCIGSAFDSDGATGGVVLHTIEHLFSTNCGQGNGHVILDGVIHFLLRHASITGASAGANFTSNQRAVRIKKTSITPRNIEIVGGEYGNSLEKGFEISGVNGFHARSLRLVKRASETTYTHGFDFLDGGANTHRGVEMSHINLQIDDATPVHTVLTIGTGVNGPFRFVNPQTVNFASGNVLYAFNSGAEDGPYTLEDIFGKQLWTPQSDQALVTKSATGTTQLDLTDGEWQRVTITATGSHTLDGPAAKDGHSMLVSILNSSGGSITVTFGSNFANVSGYTDPSSGTRTTAEFRWDAASVGWVQIGAWS